MTNDADKADELLVLAARTQMVSQMSPGLEAFERVHPSLLYCLEQTTTRMVPPEQDLSAFMSAPSVSSGSWLQQSQPETQPAVELRSNHACIGYIVMDGCFDGSPLPTTTLPPTAHSSRVADNETFNFDFGALTSHLNDQSYMAWF